MIHTFCRRGTCRERVEAMTSGDDAPFLFIMNIQVCLPLVFLGRPRLRRKRYIETSVFR